MKSIGKPYAGKPHVRFDEGELQIYCIYSVFVALYSIELLSNKNIAVMLLTMARKPRLHVTGGLYHVILRGNGGEDIFFRNADCDYSYMLLQDGITRFDA